MRDKIIFVSIFSFLFGVLLRSVFYVPETFFWIFVFSGVIFLVLFFVIKNKIFLLASLGLLFMFFGIARFHYVDINQPKEVFNEFVDTEISFEGLITSEPDRRENTQRLIVQSDEIKILVSTELYPEFSYGDKVLVKGKLKKPENFKTDIGKDFNYVDYLMKDSIFYNISFADVEKKGEGLGNPVKNFLLKTKKSFLGVLETQIQSPESSLLGGLLLGTKQSLGKDLEESFVKTGLIHIVVLSGYNVTIIGEALMRALYFLPLTASVTVGSVFIVFFAVMTGAGATIVRASIMAVLALIARATGNSADITRSLVFAGFLMILHNPYILYFDISFQLSFLATIGLIYLSPILIKYFLWLPKKFGLQDIASATIATQIFVLPFILYKIGTLSIIAPITNLIILPLIPATMFFGFLTGILGSISSFLAIPFAFVSNLLLSFEIKFVEFFSNLVFSAVNVRNFPLILVIFIYVLISWFIYKNYDNKKAD